MAPQSWFAPRHLLQGGLRPLPGSHDTSCHPGPSRASARAPPSALEPRGGVGPPVLGLAPGARRGLTRLVRRNGTMRQAGGHGHLYLLKHRKQKQVLSTHCLPRVPVGFPFLRIFRQKRGCPHTVRPGVGWNTKPKAPCRPRPAAASPPHAIAPEQRLGGLLLQLASRGG